MTPSDVHSDPGGAATLLASERAHAALRADILMGIHPPGAALRLSELRARYRIGPSPLREALFRLASQRLVLQESNRGFRVPPLDPAEWHDVVAMRRALEPAAAAAAVAAGGDAWEDTLVLAHRRLTRLGRAADLVAAGRDTADVARWESAHRAFHRALIAACGSEWTLHFCDLLSDQFDRYRRFAPPSAEAQEALSAQHAQLLETALDRDGPGCAALLDQHIDITGTAVAGGLARLNAGA